MKKLLLLTILLSLNLGFSQDNNQFISISGEIENPIYETNLIIRSTYQDLLYKKQKFEKIIHINENGKFSDTLSLPSNEYDLIYNGHQSSIYLEKDWKLILKFNSKDITKSINYIGKGFELNQFNSDKQRIFQNATQSYSKNNITDINSFIKSNLLTPHNELIKKYTGIIPDSVLNKKKKGFDGFFGNEIMVKKYLKKLKSEKSEKILLGTLAKDFTFEDSKGNLISLADFKGKYVLIDLWATWCGPCIYEFPYLEKIYSKYKDKNISFVSISIDNSRDKQKWLNLLNEKKPIGIQLFENKNGKSDFISSLNSNSIPRYLIIDKNGSFINLKAPKPSSEGELIELLDELLSQS